MNEFFEEHAKICRNAGLMGASCPAGGCGYCEYGRGKTDECAQCVVRSIGYAQAYIPAQTNTDLNEGAALANGTIFNALNMPYKRGSALKRYCGEE